MTTKDGFLRDVILNPSKSVTYRPIPNKQMAEVQISNNEQSAIIFKWKSTRPGMYKMRPVYGVLGPSEKGNISLFCKGIKDQAPTNDRYTCVMAASPSANVNPESIWSNHKYQQKLAQTGKLRKVKLNILYVGVNDKEEEKKKAGGGATEEQDDGENDEEKDRVGKMKQKEKEKKKEEEKKEEKKEKKPGDGRKKATLVMFVRKECDSASGEDEVDDTPTIAAPLQQNIMDLLKPVQNAGLFHQQMQTNVNFLPQPIPGHPGGNAAKVAPPPLPPATSPLPQGVQRVASNQNLAAPTPTPTLSPAIAKPPVVAAPGAAKPAPLLPSPQQVAKPVGAVPAQQPPAPQPLAAAPVVAVKPAMTPPLLPSPQQAPIAKPVGAVPVQPAPVPVVPAQQVTPLYPLGSSMAPNRVLPPAGAPPPPPVAPMSARSPVPPAASAPVPAQQVTPLYPLGSSMAPNRVPPPVGAPPAVSPAPQPPQNPMTPNRAPNTGGAQPPLKR